MRRLAMMMIAGVTMMPGLVFQIGCAVNPCVYVDDPTCDKTKLTTPCPPVCATNEGTEMNADVGVDSGIQDGSAED